MHNSNAVSAAVYPRFDNSCDVGCRWMVAITFYLLVVDNALCIQISPDRVDNCNSGRLGTERQGLNVTGCTHTVCNGDGLDNAERHVKA